MKPKILVIGDLMVDTIYSGHSRRASAEAPNAPVMVYEDELTTPGGAANVAMNIESMGGDPMIVGAIGCDASAGAFLHMIRGRHLAIMQVEDRPTTTKMRMVCDGQMIMRLDMEATSPIPDETVDKLLETIFDMMAFVQAIVLSDYAKGVVTPKLATLVIKMASDRGVPIIVDAKSPLASHFSGATVIKPNLNEIAGALGIAEPHTDHEAGAAAVELLRRSGASHVVLTRGAAGLCVASADGVAHIAPHVVDAVDITGAGDSVAAALAIALAHGDSIEDAARFANAAGAIAVTLKGTQGVKSSQIEALDELSAKRHAMTSQAFAGQGTSSRRH